MDRQNTGVPVDLHPDHTRFWKNLGIVLATLVTAGTIIGVLSNAFYVRRDEYQTKSAQDSEHQSHMQSNLDQLNETIRNQREAYERMNNTLIDLKTDVAVLKSQKRR